MEFGKLQYNLKSSGSGGPVRVRLTLVGQNDDEILSREGLAGLRRRRIVRLSEEAHQQGCLLSYDDLADLLVTSVATLKRDVNWLESRGSQVRLKGRRKNGVTAQVVDGAGER